MREREIGPLWRMYDTTSLYAIWLIFFDACGNRREGGKVRRKRNGKKKEVRLIQQI